jgi:hypothetical protein
MVFFHQIMNPSHKKQRLIAPCLTNGLGTGSGLSAQSPAAALLDPHTRVDDSYPACKARMDTQSLETGAELR